MIHELYASLMRAKLTNSQVHFSTVWLGRSPRYYSNLLATRREPGVATLLEFNLRLLRVALNSDWGFDARVLLELRDQLNEEISRRTLLQAPLRRSLRRSTSIADTPPTSQLMPSKKADKANAAKLSF